MRNLIIKKLDEIKSDHNVRILLAVESGSRAWGVESSDSDYDVRFIYVRPKNDYLKLENIRDVIELPMNGLLDINGWDLSKALKLLYKSNPTLFEWFSSPIVYYEDPDFCVRIKTLFNKYFSVKKGLYHYLNIAKSNNHKFLCGETVKLKIYFYVLRSILACKWILDKKCPPPIFFKELVESELDDPLKPDVDRLLNLKTSSSEIKTVASVDAIRKYIDQNINEISQAISMLGEERDVSWDLLNELFLFELSKGI